MSGDALERLERLAAEGDAAARDALQRERDRRSGLEPCWSAQHGDGGRTRCANADPIVEMPKVVWRRSLDVVQPILVGPSGDLFVFAVEGALVLDPDSGETRRHVCHDGTRMGRAALSRGCVVGRTQEGLRAVELWTGEPCWERKLPGIGGFAVGGNRLLVSVGRTALCLALSSETGSAEPLWERSGGTEYQDVRVMLSRCGQRACVDGTFVDGGTGEVLAELPGESFVLDYHGCASLEMPTLRLKDGAGALLLEFRDPHYNGDIDGEYRRSLVHGLAPRGLTPTHLITARYTFSRSSGYRHGFLQAWSRSEPDTEPTVLHDSWSVDLLAVARDVVYHHHLGVGATRLDGGELWQWDEDNLLIRDIAVGPGRIYIRTFDEIVALGVG